MDVDEVASQYYWQAPLGSRARIAHLQEACRWRPVKLTTIICDHLLVKFYAAHFFSKNRQQLWDAVVEAFDSDPTSERLIVEERIRHPFFRYEDQVWLAMVRWFIDNPNLIEDLLYRFWV